jgi:hypothetical protein
MYHTHQFVRRYAAAIAASAGLLILAIAAAVVISIRHQSLVAARERATHERERAEKLSQFMLDAFSAGDPFADVGRESTSRILLEQALVTEGDRHAYEMQTHASDLRKIQGRCAWGIAGGIQLDRRTVDVCAQHLTLDFESGPGSHFHTCLFRLHR